MVRPNKKKNSKDSPLISTVKTLQENVDDIRQKQEEQNAGLYEKLENIHDIREKQNKILEILEKQEETKKIEIQVALPEKSAILDQSTMSTTSGKEFVLRHVFKNVSSMKEREYQLSKIEEHFGVPWEIKVSHDTDHFSYFLRCLYDNKEEWMIDAWRNMKICSTTGKSRSKSSEHVFESAEKGVGRGYREFLKWDDLMKDYVIDDSLTVEVTVKINEMSGIYKENLRSFDESMEELSDVVLIVNDQKFYVLKLYLATHSSYFKALFLGQFLESRKAEISLTGIDSDDFQNYLEVLYGDPAIDETTVEGILVVADMYDTQIVVGKCEDFLLEKSKKSMRKKLEMATRFNLDKLKKKCLSEIKTAAEIKAVIPGDIRDMDPSIMAKLLEKSLSLH